MRVLAGLLIGGFEPLSPVTPQALHSNIGALIITYTILGVPYYNYSIMGPKTYSNF